METQAKKPLQILKEVFGFDGFLDGQEKVIDRLLEGNSVLAVFPTGSGKSLCYQLPALYFPGLTLVISPLIALMKDQVEFLQKNRVQAARLDSTLSWPETKQVYDDLRQRHLKILFIAPERLSNERFLQKLQGIKIDLMVIDEAHCISEWGHNFRPEYLKLARMAKQLKAARVLTLTATATTNVARDICREFAIDSESFIHTGFYRPNLTLNFTPCQSEADGKKNLLAQRLNGQPAGPTIVYVTLQKTAEEVAYFLNERGFSCEHYHAGMKNEDRETVQDWFMASDSAVVVATIAFGMGIDKANIRYVYHYNIPKSLENYSQEIGRAGRDGDSSWCEIFASGEEITILENFVYGDTPEQQPLFDFISFIMNQESEFDISIYALSSEYDIRPLVVNTILAYLELENIIQATSVFYSEYKFQLLRPFEEIYNDFDDNRAAFLESMFSHVKKGRSWYNIDISAAAELINEPRDRLVKALNYLEEKEYILLQTTGVRINYRLLKQTLDPSPIQDKLYLRFSESETRNILRIHQMIELINRQGCKVAYLLGYFGETMANNCGHCDWCMGNIDIGPLAIEYEEISDQKIDYIRSVMAENHAALGSPRKLARFFCGLPSPASTKSKLKSHPYFAYFNEIPFNQVLETIEIMNQNDS